MSLFGNGCPKDECFEQNVDDVCGSITLGKIIFFNYYNDFQDDKQPATYIGKYKECGRFMEISPEQEIRLTETYKINGDQLEKTGNEGSDGVAKFVFNRIEKTSFIYDHEEKIEQEKQSTFGSLFGKKQNENKIIEVKNPQKNGVQITDEYIKQFNNILNVYETKISIQSSEASLPKEPEVSIPGQLVEQQQSPLQPEQITDDESIIIKIQQENADFKKFPELKDSKTLNFGLIYDNYEYNTTQLLIDLSEQLDGITSTPLNIDNLVKQEDINKIQVKLKTTLVDKKLENLIPDIITFDIYDKINKSVTNTFKKLFESTALYRKNEIKANIAKNQIKITYYIIKEYITRYLIGKNFLNEGKELTPAQIKTLLRFTKSQFDNLFTSLTGHDSERDQFKNDGWLFVGFVMTKKDGKLRTGHAKLYIKPDGKIVASDDKSSGNIKEEHYNKEVEFKLFHNYKGIKLNEIKRLDIPIVESSTLNGGKTKKLRRNFKTKKQRKNKKYNITRSIKK